MHWKDNCLALVETNIFKHDTHFIIMLWDKYVKIIACEISSDYMAKYQN